MNILVFVTTMLLLIALMTYNNLANFRQSAPFRQDYVQWMENYGRESINAEALKRYESVKEGESEVSSGSVAPRQENKQTDKQESAPTPQESAVGFAKMSFSLFVDGKQREKKREIYDEQLPIMKRLIYTLYGKEEWYKDLEVSRPYFVDELLERIENRTEDKTIKTIEELANLDLDDADLNEAFYKILKGTLRKAQSKKLRESVQGYYSLLDFVNLKNNAKIRVYLAGRELLVAIYGDEKFVDEILAERRRIYKLLKGEKDKDKKLARAYGEEFKVFFTKRFGVYADERVLDFSVSKTNPVEYE